MIYITNDNKAAKPGEIKVKEVSAINKAAADSNHIR